MRTSTDPIPSRTQLSDGQGGTDDATVTLTVNPVNDPPITRNDVLTTNENTTLNGNVLGRNGNGLDIDPGWRPANSRYNSGLRSQQRPSDDFGKRRLQLHA